MARIMAIMIVAACALGVSSARGQVGTPEFEAWWSKITSGGAAGPRLDGVSLKYVRELVYIPPADELAAMRSRVAGHPIHPERFALEVYERRLKTGKPDTSEYQVWRLGSDWRLSKSYSTAELSFWDFASGPDGAWHLTPQKLTVVPQSAESQVGREVASQSSGMTLETGILITGGLLNASALRVDLRPRMITENRWAVEAVKVEESRTIVIRAEGGWDASEAVGTVSRCEVRIASPGQPDNAEIYESAGWEYQPRLGLNVAGVVTQLDARNQPVIRYRLVRVEEFDEAQFKELVRVPRLDTPDPIRGAVKVSSISDVRPGMATSWERQGATASESMIVAQSRMGAWRVAGWVVAGLLLITLVLLRVHISTKPGSRSSARSS
ncbi:MAG: hypothetical protein HBSAPP03_19730 [Phycisphaerae bacterium]|nr:MAG: hypothetical protein HBSAPP03_19730 [Phycisphaerae bacterium]